MGTAILRSRVSRPSAWSCGFVLLVVAPFLGCNGTVGQTSQPPSTIVPVPGISIAPADVSVLLGTPQIFSATISDSPGAIVNWSIAGIAGGNATVGTISNAGVYIAPRDMSVHGPLAVQAVIAGDTSLSATATLTVVSDILVSLAPQAGPVELGAQRGMGVTVTSAGNPDLTVNWSVSGTGCMAAACGTISATGTYTAPPVQINPASVIVTAVSVADPTKSATTIVNLSSTFTFEMAGPGTVNAGASADYTSALVPAPNSNPSLAIAWSVSGTNCTATACGTISNTGVYSAPLSVPAPTAVQIQATPTADPTKSVSLAVEILPNITVTVTPGTVTMDLGATQHFSAVVTGAADTTVTWDAGGVVGGSVALGTISNSQTDPDDTIYTAPQAMPPGGSVSVHAKSNANPAFSFTVIVTLVAPNGVSLSPTSATRTIGRRQTFTVQVNGVSDQTVDLQVSGIPGGNTALGQTCVTASNPCQQIASTATGSFDYVAPAGIPSPNPVDVLVTSDADRSQIASTFVTILPHDVVTVLPQNVIQGLISWLPFTATIVGTDNQQVTWNINGAACGIPGACGTVSISGVFLAPAAVPSPDLVTLIATSADDTTQTGAATIVITSNGNISLSPTSAYAGAAVGFTLEVSGIDFTPSSPGPGSTIMVAGIPRLTSCPSSIVCETSLAPADVQIPGNLAISVANPNGPSSNTVSFVVLDPGSGADTISLTAQTPSVTGKNITVVDLSTNGGSNVGVNIAAFGPYSLATGACTLGGSPFVITRPATGVGTAEVCLFSESGLDASYIYTITGPDTPDVTIFNREPLGFGIVHLTLQVPSTALPGTRTLFIENSNEDEAAATGVLEVE